MVNRTLRKYFEDVVKPKIGELTAAEKKKISFIC